MCTGTYILAADVTLCKWRVVEETESRPRRAFFPEMGVGEEGRGLNLGFSLSGTDTRFVDWKLLAWILTSRPIPRRVLSFKHNS